MKAGWEKFQVEEILWARHHSLRERSRINFIILVCTRKGQASSLYAPVAYAKELGLFLQALGATEHTEAG